MKKRNPFHVFDWYFADASEEDGARFHALSDRPKETSVLMHLVSADSIVHFALWSQLPNSHPVKELWSETQTDLLATVYLAYGGFFRQAFVILRAWFEIAVHGVFFSGHYGQPTGRYEQWRRGEREAPANMSKVAESLAQRADKAFPADKHAILQKLSPIYDFLCCQAHAQGLDIYELQEGRDNVPRYLPKSFEMWYYKFLEAFNALCFVYRLFFQREIAGYLRDSEAELQRLLELKDALGELMPEFDALVSDVVGLASS